jgi:hypothetical protein
MPKMSTPKHYGVSTVKPSIGGACSLITLIGGRGLLGG